MTDHDKFIEWEDNIWCDIKKLPPKEILRLLIAYDEYVFQIVHENQSEPVGVPEFYQYDYQEYVKGEK